MRAPKKRKSTRATYKLDGTKSKREVCLSVRSICWFAPSFLLHFLGTFYSLLVYFFLLWPAVARNAN